MMSMCHSISRITACFCLCGLQEHATQCVVFDFPSSLPVWRRNKSPPQSKFVLCVLCSLFCARIYGVLCVCVCSAFSLAQSPLHVLSCLLFPVCCAWRLVCYMDDFLVWFALYACIRYMYVHIHIVIVCMSV